MPTDNQDLKNELHRVVTTVLIYKPDFTYLITKRGMHKKVYPGKWTIPGGGLHVDDYINTPPTTSGEKIWYEVLGRGIKREMMEEVALSVDKPELLTDMTFIRPDGIPVLVLSYFAPYISGEVKLDDDNTEFAWVTVEEAKNYDLIDGIFEEIEMADKIIRDKMRV